MAATIDKLSIRVPGSSANLGPAFDCAALALALYTQLTFEILDRDDPRIPLIRNGGPYAASFPSNKSNLIYKVLRAHWQSTGTRLRRVRIEVNSQIPPSRGLGSSASIIAGAIYAAAKLAGNAPDRMWVLKKAAKVEGHGDNVSAAMCGGLVVSALDYRSGDLLPVRLAWPEEWNPLIVVPSYRVNTERARAVLPKRLTLEHAVENVQRTSLLVAAVFQRNEKLLAEALHDRLHEPYRLSLVPELGRLRKLAAGWPVLGCVLSGSGSAVLILVHQRHKAEILGKLCEWCARQREKTQVLDLQVDPNGLLELHDK